MTSRKPIIAANWKMNTSPEYGAKFAAEFKPLVTSNDYCDIVICPPFISLNTLNQSLEDSNVELGAQNLFFEDNGAFTGEISASMLKEVGCSYVILGHSERRSILNESSKWVNLKIKKAFEVGLKPILCVGEVLEERENGQMEEVVAKQTKESLANLPQDKILDLVIAYEPVWAIGTGKTASPEQAEEAHLIIRNILKELYGESISSQIRIQYGGSVKPENVKELMAKENIDGALVGGASLKVDSFSKIVNFK